MNEYVIINKTSIQKRIEELEKIDKKEIWEHMEYDTLKHILSQSTLLIPEIENAWLDGNISSTRDCKEDYISNLKLNI